MVKKYGLLLFAIVFFGCTRTMQLPDETDTQSVYISGKDETEEKIKTSWKVAKLSAVLKNIIEDLGGMTDVSIPFNAFSRHTIVQTINFLELCSKSSNVSQDAAIRQHLDAFPLDDLINIINCAHYLDINEEIMKTLNDRLLVMLHTNHGMTQRDYELLAHLNSDFVREFILSDVISFLNGKNIEKPKFSLHGHPKDVFSAVWNPDDKKIVSYCIGDYNNLKIWDAETATELYNLGPIKNVRAIAWSPDGEMIVVGSAGRENNLKIWNETGKFIRNLDGHASSISAVAWSPNGKRMVSGSDGKDNNLKIWDIETGKKLFDLNGHPDKIRSIAWSSNGEKIVSCSDGDQNNLKIWDAKTGKQIYDLAGHPDFVCSAMWSSDDAKIVSCSAGDQNNLKIWDVETGKQIHDLVGHSKIVGSVAWSPDGKRIVSGSDGKDNNLKIWDAETGQELYELIGHSNFVFSVTWSSDGKRIVSGSEGTNNNLKIWDAETGEEKHNLIGYPVQLRSVALAHDGKKIVSGSVGHYNNLIVWRMLSQQEINNLKECSVSEIMLLYRLYLTQQSNSTIHLNDVENDMLYSLPYMVRDLLIHLNLIKPLWSEWFMEKLPQYMQIRQ
jgi:WD40 repeat protein